MSEYSFTSSDRGRVKESHWNQKAGSQENYLQGSVEAAAKEMLKSGSSREEIEAQVTNAIDRVEKQLNFQEPTEQEIEIVDEIQELTQTLVDSENPKVEKVGEEILQILGSDQPGAFLDIPEE